MMNNHERTVRATNSAKVSNLFVLRGHHNTHALFCPTNKRTYGACRYHKIAPEAPYTTEQHILERVARRREEEQQRQETALLRTANNNNPSSNAGHEMEMAELGGVGKTREFDKHSDNGNGGGVDNSSSGSAGGGGGVDSEKAETRAAAKVMKKFRRRPQSLVATPQAREMLGHLVAEEDERLANWPQAGALEFDAFTVRYAPHLPDILKRVSISIPARSKVCARMRVCACAFAPVCVRAVVGVADSGKVAVQS